MKTAMKGNDSWKGGLNENHCFCRQYLLNLAAVGWDKEENEEVVMKTKKLTGAIKKYVKANKRTS